MKPEKQIAAEFAQHLKIFHGTLLWRFDLQADIKLTIGQAKRAKSLQGNPGYPDFFLAEANSTYHGLYIELKKSKSEVFKQDGTYKTGKHLLQQIVMKKRVENRGYKHEWAWSTEDAIQKLNNYLTIK